MKKIIGVVSDNRYLDHKIGQLTKECPERLKNIYLEIEKPSYSKYLKNFSPRVITDQELLAVHSQFYIDQIKHYCVHENPYAYDRDTYLMRESLYTSQLAAGGCIVLADAIMTGEIDRGFALVRPPGHHADTGRGIGFCILNNIAITAKYLEDKYKLDRILIVDFDVHHSNGTQEIFYLSDKTLVISIHQENLFPFSGKTNDLGKKNGLGYNINIPVNPQFGDLEYKYIFGKVIQNIAEQYLPQIILVSAGFDAHIDDPISKTSLTTGGFRDITEILKYFAKEFCNDKLLYILEGGYNLESLKNSVMTSIDSLVESDVKKPGFGLSSRVETLLTSGFFNIINGKWTIV
ncbi:MAG: histone deacetylase [Desulfobacterales bacterium]|nr:histone deacetylase [Desulfobacterales bacterium]MCP4161619.1 histone deacetylase [Deltaproteobacteria bacterium]